MESLLHIEILNDCCTFNSTGILFETYTEDELFDIQCINWYNINDMSNSTNHQDIPFKTRDHEVS